MAEVSFSPVTEHQEKSLCYQEKMELIKNAHALYRDNGPLIEKI